MPRFIAREADIRVVPQRTADVLVTARRRDLTFQGVQNTVEALQAQFTDGAVDFQVVTRSHNLTFQRDQKTVWGSKRRDWRTFLQW